MGIREIGEDMRQEWRDRILRTQIVDGLHIPQLTAMFDGIIQFALAAIKGALLLNGGAAVALLSFMATKTITDPSRFALAIILFCAGAICAVITAGVSYMAQCTYQLEGITVWTIDRTPEQAADIGAAQKYHSRGNVLRITACSLLAISIVLFCVGLYSSYANICVPTAR